MMKFLYTGWTTTKKGLSMMINRNSTVVVFESVVIELI